MEGTIKNKVIEMHGGCTPGDALDTYRMIVRNINADIEDLVYFKSNLHGMKVSEFLELNYEDVRHYFDN